MKKNEISKKKKEIKKKKNGNKKFPELKIVRNHSISVSRNVNVRQSQHLVIVRVRYCQNLVNIRVKEYQEINNIKKNEFSKKIKCQKIKKKCKKNEI